MITNCMSFFENESKTAWLTMLRPKKPGLDFDWLFDLLSKNVKHLYLSQFFRYER